VVLVEEEAETSLPGKLNHTQLLSREISRESGFASQVDLCSTMIRGLLRGEFQGIWFSFEVPL